MFIFVLIFIFTSFTHMETMKSCEILWIYGFDIKDVFYSIKNGQPNGMPEHASKLNPIEIQQVSSYVLQLPFIQGTKPAQGDKIEK